MPRHSSRLKSDARGYAAATGVPYGEALRLVSARTRIRTPRPSVTLPDGPTLALSAGAGGMFTTTTAANLAVCLALRGLHVGLGETGDMSGRPLLGYLLPEIRTRVPGGGTVTRFGPGLAPVSSADVCILDVDSAACEDAGVFAGVDAVLIPQRISKRRFTHSKARDHRPVDVVLFEYMNDQYGPEYAYLFAPGTDLTEDELEDRDDFRDWSLGEWGDVFDAHIAGWAAYNDRVTIAGGSDTASYGGFAGGIERVTIERTAEQVAGTYLNGPGIGRLADEARNRAIGLAVTYEPGSRADDPQVAALAVVFAEAGLPFIGPAIPEFPAAVGGVCCLERPEHPLSQAYAGVAEAAMAAMTRRR